MNIQIKSLFTAAVLFENDSENNSTRRTLELAVKSGADLYGADLYGADLYGAEIVSRPEQVNTVPSNPG